MTKPKGGRPGFREWVDKQPNPGWPLMPLTHIANGIHADDIVRDGQICAFEDGKFDAAVAYFFYGRPAYRLNDEGAVKVEAACPYCFIFDPSIIKQARAVHAFDTGAFAKRLYKHILLEDMAVDDFSLERDNSRPNKIISRVFGSREAYFDGDTSKLEKPEEIAEAWEFHARSYLHLLASPGRNEPDDRICSIEVVVGTDIPLQGNLRAVVAPHTLWGDNKRAPWLEKLNDSGVEISPYIFVPGRHPEHYHALLETQVRSLYKKWNAL